MFRSVLEVSLRDVDLLGEDDAWAGARSYTASAMARSPEGEGGNRAPCERGRTRGTERLARERGAQRPRPPGVAVVVNVFRPDVHGASMAAAAQSVASSLWEALGPDHVPTAPQGPPAGHPAASAVAPRTG